MKKWNLIKLHLEWGLRSLSLVIGSFFAVFLFMLSISYFNVDKNYLRKSNSHLSIFDLADLISGVVLCLIAPILISIFIIVATRKFKELNQLIEENKKL